MNELFDLFDAKTNNQEDDLLDILEAELKYLFDEGFIKELEDGSYDVKSEEELAREMKSL